MTLRVRIWSRFIWLRTESSPVAEMMMCIGICSHIRFNSSDNFFSAYNGRRLLPNSSTDYVAGTDYCLYLSARKYVGYKNKF
jgi:hypothetical protein